MEYRRASSRILGLLILQLIGSTVFGLDPLWWSDLLRRERNLRGWFDAQLPGPGAARVLRTRTMGNQRSRINSWTQYRRVSRAYRSVVTTDGEQVAILTALVRKAALSSEVRVTCHVAARHRLIDL